MEIDDGGAARAEFASDPETEAEGVDKDSSDSETEELDYEHLDTDIENTADYASEPESGELASESEEEKNTEICAISTKKKASRSSVEDRLDSMSNTLMAVQELLLKNGLAGDVATSKGDEKAKNNKPSKKRNSGVENTVISQDSSSEMTNYHNALEKINEASKEINVDPEITFKVVEKLDVTRKEKNRDSSSSEDRIDTSDEMIDAEVENADLEFNPDKFIA